jgi:hypothetical protein
MKLPPGCKTKISIQVTNGLYDMALIAQIE